MVSFKMLPQYMATCELLEFLSFHWEYYIPQQKPYMSELLNLGFIMWLRMCWPVFERRVCPPECGFLFGSFDILTSEPKNWTRF